MKYINYATLALAIIILFVGYHMMFVMPLAADLTARNGQLSVNRNAPANPPAKVDYRRWRWGTPCGLPFASSGASWGTYKPILTGSGR